VTNIRSKMASGALWMVLAKLAERSLGTLSMLILARVLVPHDFGIVAMAMSFVALLELLSAFGFEVALIQKQTKERSHWDTAWTFNVIVGIAIATLMFIGARPVAGFFREPALVAVLCALAIGSAAQGFQNIGLVAFRTEMRFDREFRFLTAKKLISFVITIPLAITLDSYWALVIGQTAGRIFSTGLSYWVHPYRPRLCLSATRDLFGFSRWMLILNIIGFVRERSAAWVIGRIAGPAPLGAFTISYEITSLPGSELVAPINRAVFPAYAKLAAEGVDALRREYLSVIAVIVLLATPAVLGLAATAPLLVPVMLGPNWESAIPVLTLLSFFGLTSVVQTNAQAAYLALGRVDIPSKMNTVNCIVLLAALVPMTHRYGAVGAAAAYLINAVVMIPISLGVVLRMLNIRVTEFVAQVWRPLLAAALMYLSVWTYVRFVAGTRDSGAENLLHLLMAVGLGATLYVLLSAGLWALCGRPPGAERFAFNKAVELAARLRWRKAAAS
jgi:lipopolysaccharide exporter